jgi:hypothetical protein
MVQLRFQLSVDEIVNSISLYLNDMNNLVLNNIFRN